MKTLDSGNKYSHRERCSSHRSRAKRLTAGFRHNSCHNLPPALLSQPSSEALLLRSLHRASATVCACAAMTSEGPKVSASAGEAVMALQVDTKKRSADEVEVEVNYTVNDAKSREVCNGVMRKRVCLKFVRKEVLGKYADAASVVSSSLAQCKPEMTGLSLLIETVRETVLRQRHEVDPGVLADHCTRMLEYLSDANFLMSQAEAAFRDKIHTDILDAAVL